MFAPDRAPLIVAGSASEGFSRFDPGKPLAHITEGERRSDLPDPAAELLRKTAQHGRLPGQADTSDSGRDGLQSDCAGELATLLGQVARLLEHNMTRCQIGDALSVFGRGHPAVGDRSLFILDVWGGWF